MQQLNWKETWGKKEEIEEGDNRNTVAEKQREWENGESKKYKTKEKQEISHRLGRATSASS